MSVNAISMTSPEMINQKAKAFVNMSDRDLQGVAISSVQDKRKPSKVMNRALVAMPVVAAVASGILHKGSLSAKALSGVVAGGSFVVPLALLGIFNGISDKISKKSEKFKNFREDKPIVAMIADVATFFGALVLANKGLSKGINALAQKFPRVVDKMDLKLTKVAEKLDAGKVNTKVLPWISSKLSKVTEKLPFTKSVADFTLRNAHWAVLLGGILKSASVSNAQNREALANYNYLKNAQVEVAKEIA
jgi:hypothetical protein